MRRELKSLSTDQELIAKTLRKIAKRIEDLEEDLNILDRIAELKTSLYEKLKTAGEAEKEEIYEKLQRVQQESSRIIDKHGLKTILVNQLKRSKKLRQFLFEYVKDILKNKESRGIIGKEVTKIGLKSLEKGEHELSNFEKVSTRLLYTKARIGSRIVRATEDVVHVADQISSFISSKHDEF